MGNAPDLDWGKLFKAVWRYVLLLVGAWLALRYCSYHDSVMGDRKSTRLNSSHRN